jgi:hypothetical protein
MVNTCDPWVYIAVPDWNGLWIRVQYWLTRWGIIVANWNGWIFRCNIGESDSIFMWPIEMGTNVSAKLGNWMMYCSGPVLNCHLRTYNHTHISVCHWHTPPDSPMLHPKSQPFEEATWVPHPIDWYHTKNITYLSGPHEYPTQLNNIVVKNSSI